MGVISKRGIRGENKRPGRACQHCDLYWLQVIVCGKLINING